MITFRLKCQVQADQQDSLVMSLLHYSTTVQGSQDQDQRGEAGELS